MAIITEAIDLDLPVDVARQKWGEYLAGMSPSRTVTTRQMQRGSSSCPRTCATTSTSSESPAKGGCASRVDEEVERKATR